VGIFLEAEGVNTETTTILVKAAMRRRSSFLDPNSTIEHAFGLTDCHTLLKLMSSNEERIRFLRKIAKRRDLQGKNLVIRYAKDTTFLNDVETKKIVLTLSRVRICHSLPLPPHDPERWKIQSYSLDS
jgi:hypothetical protein